MTKPPLKCRLGAAPSDLPKLWCGPCRAAVPITTSSTRPASNHEPKDTEILPVLGQPAHLAKIRVIRKSASLERLALQLQTF